MKIIIDIPDTAYEGIINASKASGNWDDSLVGILCNGVANGTPLPKGHGRLIDVNDIEWAKHKEEKGHIEYDVVDWDEIENAPTIIEADKEEEG